MIGLETTLFIFNIGSILLVILLYPVLVVISTVNKVVGCCKKETKFESKFNKFVFWNQPIVTMQEVYLMLVMSALINLHYLEWGNLLE
jgi:hypothetical protein